MAAIALALNLTLNIILIKRFGIVGAAAANATTQLFTAIYQVVLVKRIFRFKTDFGLLVRLAVFIVLIGLTSMLITHLGIQWYYSLGIYLLIGALLSFALGLIKLKSIYEIMLSNQ
jgi:O-antigen/teichoic acid export membrane protein